MDIRKTFLDYFQSKGHKLVPSSPLVPDDPTLMFTNAGMVQFKNIFTGEAPIPNPPRATSSQTCLRAGGKHNDLDNVGYTARHHTLFEMLGNFSFADYFKEDAIAYAWEFVTDEKYLDLPVEKIWVTVHDSDDEAYDIWKKYISEDRIMRFGDKDNFWQMGDTGPCGPCSEIFYDQGAEHFHSEEDVMGGEGDRFLEIWNLVFMQYERDEKGTLNPLPKPSIDTGMGLERVVAIKEGVFNNYHSSLFMPFLEKIGELVGKPYDFDAPNSASYRVIADHLRSVSFLLAQGVNFDKEGRGYVLRRIMRRAIRHGYLLGLREPFMYKLVDTLVDLMGKQYDYLASRAEAIKTSMKMEEERFFETIEAGIKLFNEELKNTQDVFNGEVAFKLYDTFGFPLDLTEDMLREKNIRLDIDAFNKKMEAQKAQSKANWKGTGDAATTGDFKLLKEEFNTNEFVGYETQEVTTKVLALLDENFKKTDAINGKGWVLLEKTPFYAESGGQVGDKGKLEIRNEKLEIRVLDTKKFLDMNLSEVEGKLSVGDEVKAVVDPSRVEIEKHHSATHLLHAGLRAILGDHIAQAGSLNDDKRLRFDFSHPKAMTAEEIEKVEAWVNDKISRAIPRKTEIMSVDEAKKAGAMALFGEKYGNEVRVVSMGDASIELCGGTHVDNTAQIGLFMITKESGVSAGVRRIEAICGRAAVEKVKALREELSQIKEEVKNQNPIAGIAKLKEQIKTLKSEVASAMSASQKELSTVNVNGVNVIVEEVQTGDIKSMIDDVKNKYDNVAVMLFQKKGDKVLLAAGSKNTPIKAGDWIKAIAPIVGGGGGGRPDFAQAGGKDASRITTALEEAKVYLSEILEGGN
ncbi:alanine--tRNA ligase [Sulfurovum sp. NBC37-1]|uniref:Alanine--tRNA ligase n=1 Tax=Sulfurovum sp. (strain NBC37-1) TaxID=387093 RepID=SYA_SULNB|nr:alanine--tRNA ligase [Sulfurovum sp. NBC37-1]A6Q747.1 RecName: Full=Alanine--tRNA ligase; AltName: Full=Alanyl-tRNA synthetase; Short=AlaRS [Sulfurovum sp. NBC37-1]BAF71306.1 alanyl-tRNA synthetase [Sulfurovum sp. NBC37-1]